MTSHNVSTTASVPAPEWEPLAPPRTIDDVLRGIDQILDWSVNAQSTIGYFAVLYKRVTVAIREAIDDGVFDDGSRIERLDVVFAQRYFDALNAYFYPDKYEGLTLPWEVTFVADHERTIILQHMMAGLNAHITFDLAPALLAIGADSLKGLENDFYRVNAVLGSQVPGVLDIIVQRSPWVRWIRRLIPREIWILRRVVKKLRKSAWLFAIHVALHPSSARVKGVNQASWTAAIGAWYLEPPVRLTPFPLLIRLIAKRENRNVAGNIVALEGVMNKPAKMKATLLPPACRHDSKRRARAYSGHAAPPGKRSTTSASSTRFSSPTRSKESSRQRNSNKVAPW